MDSQNTSKPVIYLVGPSTGTRGGIGYVIGAYLSSNLRTHFRLIHIVTHRDGSPLLKAWTGVKALIWLILLRVKCGNGLVHIHSSSGASFLRKALFFFVGKGLGCRIVFHIHSGHFLDYYQNGGRAIRFLIRYVLNTSDQVVVLTGSWQKKIAEIVRKGTRISVVGNPIDISKYHPCSSNGTSDGEPHLLFLGALIKNKGVYDIVDCLGRLKGAGVAVRVTLAGDRELEKVRQHSRAVGVEDRITLPGWVDEPTKLQLLTKSDVLLLPSYKEGLPLCVLEAMAVGLPVVCSNVGGLGDLVTHGENGFCIEPGDVDSMAKYISALAQEPKLRQQMGLRNVKMIRDFYGVDAVAHQVAHVYRETLDQPKGRLSRGMGTSSKSTSRTWA